MNHQAKFWSIYPKNISLKFFISMKQYPPAIFKHSFIDSTVFVISIVMRF
jgi:hypothetical protein